MRVRREYQSIWDKELQRVGGQEIIAAMESNLLDIHSFDVSSPNDVTVAFQELPEIVRQFSHEVEQVLSNASTYPLFDNYSGEIAQEFVQSDTAHFPESARSRGSHAALMATLLQRLPVLERASIDEILDIRKELSAPLVRFRSGMMQFSEKITSAPWEADFLHKAREIILRDIEPAVLELDEEIRSNKYLKILTRKVLDRPLALAGGSALALGVSKLADIPQLLGYSAGLGTAVASGALAYDAFHEWRERYAELEKNQLFFYYKAVKETR